MTDRDFWLLIRRALLMICKAIETRYATSQAGAGAELSQSRQ